MCFPPLKQKWMETGFLAFCFYPYWQKHQWTQAAAIALHQLEVVSWRKMPREQHLGLYWSQQPEGLEAFQLELGADRENFSVKWEAAAIAEVLARHKATPPVAPPLVLLLSVARRKTATCSVWPTHCQWMPISSQLHSCHSFLANPFHSIHIKPFSSCYPWPYSSPLFGLTGLPFPSSVSAAQLYPGSPRQTQTKDMWKYMFSSCQQATNSFSSWGTGAGPVPPAFLQ